jgi:hypothetical protein
MSNGFDSGLSGNIQEFKMRDQKYWLTDAMMAKI